MLRSMRKEYKMYFAESGKEALEIMETDKIDIVVSDMRMPGMDGAQLLTKVQEKHPHVVRVMLTGQADEESIMRTVGVVHQFLAKPCDPEKLKTVLLKAGALQDILITGELKKIVSKIGSLPSLPSVYLELQNAVSDPEIALDVVGAIIEKDIAMSAKVLQLVNSAFFGLFAKVDSPARAVSLLGLDTTKALVLGVGVFSQFTLPLNMISAESIWEHSMLVGKIARKIAQHENADSDMVATCYLSGILHDIGKLVLISNMPDKYSTIINKCKKESITLLESEMQVLQAGHDSIGAYLVGLWGFSSDTVEAVGFHHQLGRYPADTFSAAMAVHAADVIYYQYKRQEVIGKETELCIPCIEKVNPKGKFEEWKELCADYFVKREVME